jgi:adenylate cyclase class 2
VSAALNQGTILSHPAGRFKLIPSTKIEALAFTGWLRYFHLLATWPKRQTMSASGLEIEVKVPASIALLEAHPEVPKELMAERHFEDNWLLDFDDGRLKQSGTILRVRKAADRGFITFKGPATPHPQFKVREELEVETDDPDRFLALFERLGLRPTFRYQKYRTVYRLKLPSTGTLLAMVDETPIGNFIEFEGASQAIEELLDILHLDRSTLITLSYPALRAEYCRNAGKPVSDMVFG